MTDEPALACADALVALINSSPRSPTREQLAGVVRDAMNKLPPVFVTTAVPVQLGTATFRWADGFCYGTATATSADADTLPST